MILHATNSPTKSVINDITADRLRVRTIERTVATSIIIIDTVATTTIIDTVATSIIIIINIDTVAGCTIIIDTVVGVEGRSVVCSCF